MTRSVRIPRVVHRLEEKDLKQAVAALVLLSRAKDEGVATLSTVTATGEHAVVLPRDLLPPLIDLLSLLACKGTGVLAIEGEAGSSSANKQ